MREHTKSEKKCRPCGSIFFFIISFFLSQNAKKKRKKERLCHTNELVANNITTNTTPEKKSEKKKKKKKKNKRSVVRSFVRHGRWRHPNEEEHLVETETTRWRGRRVRTFFFRRHFPLAFVSLFSLPDGKNVRAFVRADASSSSSFFCVPKSSSGSPGRQIQNRKRLHR